MRSIGLVGVAIAALGAAACGSEDPAGTPPGVVPPPTTVTSYYRDAKPIVDAKCARCHVADGIAPFPLTTYEEVALYADIIKQVVNDRTMPPWNAADGCADYLDDRSLEEAHIASLTAWVDEGAPQGDPKSVGETIQTGPITALSRVDLNLPMQAEYTAQSVPDDYRCFVMDWPEAATTHVTGFRANPGNPQVVHHVIAFLATPGDVATADALDAAEEGPGYTCFGGPGFQGNWLGAWAPGSQGSDFPAGTGITVEPGSKVVVQIHYNSLTAGAQPDLTTLDFKLDATVAKEAVIQPWANPQWLQGDTMIIPAMGRDVMHSWTIDPTPYISSDKPFTIYSAGLHMHTLGTSALFSIQRKGGASECMLDIPRWDFHWQGSYGFVETKTFNPGDKLYLECHWDNTTANDVTWGEGTGDEMCLGSFYYTVD